MVYSDYPIFRGEQQLPIFLLNMGLHLCQDHVVRPEGHSSPQILFCTRGSGTLVISGNRLNVPAGSAIFLPAALPLLGPLFRRNGEENGLNPAQPQYYANEDVWDIHWVIPGGSAAEEVLRLFGLEQPGVFELSDTRTLEHIFRKMHDAIRADSFFGNFRASGYLYDFLIEFYRLISSGSSSRAPSPALMRALDLINSRFAEPLGMDDLCSAAGVSKQHLCLLFRNILCLRPMEYIAKRRIQEAKSLLTSTELSIADIAEQTGFGSESYFCKLFRRYEGMTPSAFRNVK